MDHLFPHVDECSTIIAACPRHSYSASRIAHAVEDCDAHILNLNITDDSESDPSNRLIVEIRVNHRNPAAIARSIERYGYEVIDFSSSGDYPDSETARQRIEELMRYLEI